MVQSINQLNDFSENSISIGPISCYLHLAIIHFQLFVKHHSWQWMWQKSDICFQVIAQVLFFFIKARKVLYLPSVGCSSEVYSIFGL